MRLGLAPLRAMAGEQAARWPLLFAIAIMAGAAVWLTASEQPPAWLAASVMGAGGAGLAIALVWARGGANWALWLAAAAGLVVCLGLGGLCAQVRTHLAEAPRLERTLDDVLVTGFVTETIQGAERPRMILRVVAIDGVERPPVRASVATLPGAGMPAGRAVQCRAFLAPPEGPMAPHAYDAARSAYFDQIGASGFTLGRCRPISAPALADGWAKLEIQIAAWRRALAEAVYAASPNDGGAVAAALITGDRSLMSADAVVAFRDSGLGHLLSVSGLHMSLVGGGVFAALWFVLALIPKLPLYAPIKKIAAAGALIVLTIYLVVSGMSVPAVRAYIMAGIAFGAVLIDRPAITMRGLAAALGIVVIVVPDSVLEAGFQMSFAATAALVALFEVMQRRRVDPGDPGALISAVQGVWASIATVLMISLVAGLATDPFALYHFQRVTLYGLPANLATAPVISFVVAPAALLACVLAPFGLAAVALEIMADALQLVVAIGAMFASRPEAVLSVPAIAPEVFVLIIVGLLWLTVWIGFVRWLGVIFLAAALGLWAQTAPSVVLFDGDLRAIVFRESVSGDAAAAAPRMAWRSLAGRRSAAFAQGRLSALAGLTPAVAEALAPPDRCSAPGAGCQWVTPRGAMIALAVTPEEAALACRDHALVLLVATADAAARQACPQGALIDADDRQMLGGGVVREDAGGLTVERARSWAGSRPWTGPLTRPLTLAQNKPPSQTAASSITPN